MKAKVWIARDPDGSLYLFEGKPVLINLDIFVPEDNDRFLMINKDSHPEITFENSPQLIEV